MFGQRLAPIQAFPKCLEPGIEVKVLVLNFDPKVDDKSKTMREELGYAEPRALADEFIQDVALISGNFIKYRVVDWREIDQFPAKKDGFAYTAASYLSAKKGETKWHEPDALDYAKLIASNKFDEKEVDEIWLFGGPYFGFFESAMAGPRSFRINGDAMSEIPLSKPTAIMGFNYERGVAEMIHNLAHRVEATMSRIYGEPDYKKLDTPWARFSASSKTASGFAGVGSCHWPPNAEKEYDYGSLNVAWSNADGWFNYPNVDKRPKPVSRENWGGPDWQRNYLKWWFARLPKLPDKGKDGRVLNWWKYVYQFDNYDANGKAIKR